MLHIIIFLFVITIANLYNITTNNINFKYDLYYLKIISLKKIKLVKNKNKLII